MSYLTRYVANPAAKSISNRNVDRASESDIA